MRVVQLGKRHYAFELAWTPLEARKPSEAARADIPVEDELESGNQPVWTAVAHGSAGGVLGWGSIEPGMPSRVWSYAEALARNAKPGIYVAPVDEEQLWYVVIADGMPVPGTDVARPNDLARRLIGTMAEQYGLRVLAAAGSEIYLPGAGEFDAERIVAKVKMGPMRRASGRGKGLAAAAILGSTAVGFGLAVKMLLFPGHEGPSPATIAAQERGAYIAAARSALGAHPLPADAGWVVTAFERSRAAFPSGVGGMRLEAVVCESAVCTATYRSQVGDAPPVMEALRERAGGRLRFDTSGGVLVSIPLPKVDVVNWDDARIVDPVRESASAQEVAADTLSRFYPVEVAAPVLGELARMPASMGTAAVFSETLTVTSGFPETVQLKGLAALYAHAGFGPIRLEYNAQQFKVDFSRYIGGEPN